MHFMTIEVCKNRAEAEARKEIVKAGAPDANWQSRIVDNLSAVMPFLVTDLGQDPEALPPVFTPATGNPPAPASVLIIWTED